MAYRHLAAVLVPVSIAALSAAGLAQTASPEANDPAKQRRICRNVANPGSLAGRRRVCLTREEWDRSAEEHRRRGEEWIRAQDSCSLRAEGGTPPPTTPGQTSAAIIARSTGC